MTLDFDVNALSTPCYLVDESGLIKNLEILKKVSEKSGCRILLAQKAFSMFYFYPLIGQYLHGTAASGPFEARLGFEKMGKENHVYSPAYRKEDFEKILQICDHIIFNSLSQWETHKKKALKSGKSFGLRINPECSTQGGGIYDPCAPFSRLGITRKELGEDLPIGIDGLHFHTLCEQNAGDLDKTLKETERLFAPHLNKVKWVNFGGGHHITRFDYDVDLLIKNIIRFREKYNVTVYLEPGEAIALNTGFLVTTLMDIVENGMPIAILDTAVPCHMPDVLEVPYTPKIIGAGKAGEKAHTYRLGGLSCLAGDIAGDYSFDKPLKISDKLIFCDMAHYTMVKNNTFNGVPLPNIYVLDSKKNIRLIKQFGYFDFENRLS